MLVDEVEPRLGPLIVEPGAELIAFDLLVVVVAPAGRQPNGRESAKRVVELAVEIDPALLELGVTRLSRPRGRLQPRPGVSCVVILLLVVVVTRDAVLGVVAAEGDRR